MLETLLRMIASKGTECSFVLARRLGVSHALMENMIDDLVQQGYLEAVVGGCSVPCERCPEHTACLFRGQARIWALTPKGASLLVKREEEGTI